MENIALRDIKLYYYQYNTPENNLDQQIFFILEVLNFKLKIKNTTKMKYLYKLKLKYLDNA